MNQNTRPVLNERDVMQINATIIAGLLIALTLVVGGSEGGITFIQKDYLRLVLYDVVFFAAIIVTLLTISIIFLILHRWTLGLFVAVGGYAIMILGALVAIAFMILYPVQGI